MSRIKVFLKRIYNDNDELILSYEDLKLYTSSMKLYRGNEEIELTSTEFKLLFVMMRNMNQVLTREQIIESAFGMDYEGFDRSIDTYIKRIRQKIEPNPKQPLYLKTKYGSGYVFGGGNQ